jgi:hypothetical protein
MLPPLNGGSNYERDLNMFTICQRVELHSRNDVKHFRIQKLIRHIPAAGPLPLVESTKASSGPADGEGGTTSGQLKKVLVRTGKAWQIAR